MNNKCLQIVQVTEEQAQQTEKLAMERKRSSVAVLRKRIVEGEPEAVKAIAFALLDNCVGKRSFYRVMNKTARAKKKIRTQEVQIKALKQKLADKNIMREGKRRKKSSVRRNYSLRGGYSMALARNIGHASLEATLAMLDTGDNDADMLPTRQSAANWEHSLGANLQAA